MELLAGALALYLLVKIGWPVIKFIGLIVALAMIMQSCGARAHFIDRDNYVRRCLERGPDGLRAIAPDRIRLGSLMQIKGDK